VADQREIFGTGVTNLVSSTFFLHPTGVRIWWAFPLRHQRSGRFGPSAAVLGAASWVTCTNVVLFLSHRLDCLTARNGRRWFAGATACRAEL